MHRSPQHNLFSWFSDEQEKKPFITLIKKTLTFDSQADRQTFHPCNCETERKGIASVPIPTRLAFSVTQFQNPASCQCRAHQTKFCSAS